MIHEKLLRSVSESGIIQTIEQDAGSAKHFKNSRHPKQPQKSRTHAKIIHAVIHIMTMDIYLYTLKLIHTFLT